MNNDGGQTRNTEIKLNVKVECLKSSGAPEYNSRLTTQTINEMWASVNVVWKCANIRWRVMSCKQRILTPRISAELAMLSTKRELRQLFRQILSTEPPVIRERIWEVCLLNHFPVSSWGVYLPETQIAFAAELSKQNKPNAVTLAHELGHMLGLQHVEYDGNLMNPNSLRELQDILSLPLGFENRHLNEQQITDARAQAMLGAYSSQRRF